MGGGESKAEVGGFRLFKINPGSPAFEAGLEVFFDFIIEINGVKMDHDQSKFYKNVQESENKRTKLVVYNIRTHAYRDVFVTPRQWGGAGLLGAVVRYDTLENENNQGLRCLEVFPNSPAEESGLIPHKDYLLGTTEVMFRDMDELVEIVNLFLGKQLQIYVYNSDTEQVREVTLTPKTTWGGEGAIGADIRTGLLHRIPPPRRHFTFAGPQDLQPSGPGGGHVAGPTVAPLGAIAAPAQYLQQEAPPEPTEPLPSTAGAPVQQTQQQPTPYTATSAPAAPMAPAVAPAPAVVPGSTSEPGAMVAQVQGAPLACAGVANGVGVSAGHAAAFTAPPLDANVAPVQPWQQQPPPAAAAPLSSAARAPVQPAQQTPPAYNAMPAATALVAAAPAQQQPPPILAAAPPVTPPPPQEGSGIAAVVGASSVLAGLARSELDTSPLRPPPRFGDAVTPAAAAPPRVPPSTPMDASDVQVMDPAVSTMSPSVVNISDIPAGADSFAGSPDEAPTPGIIFESPVAGAAALL